MTHPFKRIISVLSAALLICGKLPQNPPLLLCPAITASAADSDGTCGENLTWVLDKDGTLTISGTGDMEDYADASPAPWNAQKENIKTVVIGDGITGIGNSAFDGCTKLTAVTIPEGVTSIDDSVFYGCKSLTSVRIPASVTAIGRLAFQGCAGLTEIVLPDGVISIGNYAFYGCAGLTAFTIPKGVTGIGVNAFAFCAKLTDITIPAGVASIGSCAFIDCTNMKSITILNPECEIAYSEFARMVPKTTVIRGYASSTAQGYADYFGQAFEEIIAAETPSSGTCGENLTWTLDDAGTLTISGKGAIADYTPADAPAPWFTMQDQIRTVIIEDGVTGIGNYAFDSLHEVTQLTLPDSVTVIGEGAFRQCIKMTIYGYAGSCAETYAKENSIPFSALDAQPVKGDFNGDGAADTSDAVLLARFIAEDITLKDDQLRDIQNAGPDYDGDGLLTILDAIAILRKLGTK